MNAADVAVRVKAIQALKDDDEKAHVTEDALYLDVLNYIANNDTGHSGRLARAATESRKIEFQRWCG